MALPEPPAGRPEASDNSSSGYGGRAPLWSRIILPDWLMKLVVACLVGVLNMLDRLFGPDEKENRHHPEH